MLLAAPAMPGDLGAGTGRPVPTEATSGDASLGAARFGRSSLLLLAHLRLLVGQLFLDRLLEPLGSGGGRQIQLLRKRLAEVVIVPRGKFRLSALREKAHDRLQRILVQRVLGQQALRHFYRFRDSVGVLDFRRPAEGGGSVRFLEDFPFHLQPGGELSGTIEARAAEQVAPIEARPSSQASFSTADLNASTSHSTRQRSRVFSASKSRANGRFLQRARRPRRLVRACSLPASGQNRNASFSRSTQPPSARPHRRSFWAELMRCRWATPLTLPSTSSRVATRSSPNFRHRSACGRSSPF